MTEERLREIARVIAAYEMKLSGIIPEEERKMLTSKLEQLCMATVASLDDLDEMAKLDDLVMEYLQK